MIYRIAVISSLLTTACQADEWKGFVYPEKGNLLEHVELGSFPTLEACRTSAQSIMTAAGWIQNGDYECGLNCRKSANFGDLQICEETKR